MNKVIIVVFCFLMAACANNFTRENFDTGMRSSYGQDLGAIVKKWGEPHASRDYENGQKAYLWHYDMTQIWDQNTRYPGPAVSAFSHWPSARQRLMTWGPYGYAGYLGGAFSPWSVRRPMRLIHHCTLQVNTDAAGKVVSHKAVGDNCVA